jgi:RHS repeat-associated protein
VTGSSRTLGRAALAVVVLFLALAASARAQPTYSLPGGAPGSDTGDGSGPFSGLAAIPQANLFTGAAATSIAIEVPPGRGRATPRLELIYSSQRGAGPYGYGWDLPLARIVRSTRQGVPRYDATDTFVLETASGASELVRVGTSRRFQAEVEAAFLRIGFDDSANTWKLIDKSGTEFHFGLTQAARTGPNPAQSDTTYAWLLEQSVDSFGNHVDYDYLSAAPGLGAPGLPLVVRYGGNLRTARPHIFSVEFAWTAASYPSQAPVSYRAGFAQPQGYVLLAIETYAAGRIVRRYSTSHEQDPISGVNRLVGMTLDGFAENPARDVSLPTTVFRYGPAVQTGWPLGAEAERTGHAFEFPSPGGFRKIGGSVRFDTLDIDGDALVDYLDTRPAVPTMRRGTGFGFAAPAPWPWPTEPRKIRNIDADGNLDISVFDITGDGLADLVDARQTPCGTARWCVFRNTGSGFATSPEIWPAVSNHLRAVDAGGTLVRRDLVDLDGDGRPDLVDATQHTAASPYWRVHRNTGTGFASTPTLFRAPKNRLSRTVTSGGRYHLVFGPNDMNGDGLVDFVDTQSAATDGYWRVHLNTGAGFADSPIAWRIEGTSGISLPGHVTQTDSNESSSKTFTELVDMTGDGRPDWVRAMTAQDQALPGFAAPACTAAPACSGTGVPPTCCASLLVFVNTGSSFSSPVGWPAWHADRLRSYSEAPSPTQREFDLFDFDGDGLVDLVEIEDGSWRVFPNPASPLATGSPTPSADRTRPNLMTAMLNGVGGETYLEYGPAALMTGNRIPFPHWVLMRNEVYDGLGEEPARESRLVYTAGAYDGDDRELHGFGLVWEEDGIGRSTATEFLQDDRLKGLAAHVWSLANPGCSPVDPFDPEDPCTPWNEILSEKENVWLPSGPALLSRQTSTPYFGGYPVAAMARSVDLAYDAFGNAISETVSSPSATAVVTTTSYAQTVANGPGGMPSRYLVDRPLETQTRESGATQPLLHKRFTYDAASPVSGELRLAETCIELSSIGCARWSTISYTYDSHGNPLTIVSPRGHVTSFTYDAHALYARATENAAGHRTEAARDLGTGKVTLVTDSDGQRVSTEYDGLGRPVVSWRNELGAEGPELVTTYFEGVPGVAAGFVRTDQTGIAPSVVFFDGLGRRIGVKTIVETGVATVTVVEGLRSYTATGALAAEGVRFIATNPDLETLEQTVADAPAQTEYAYDDQGRLVETRLPDGARVIHDDSYPGVRIVLRPNLLEGTTPGSAEITLVDGLGRIWRKDQCSAAPDPSFPDRCRPGTRLTRSEYFHDGLDRPVAISTGAHTTTPAITEIQYDGVGNRIVVDGSNSGRWVYTYTDDGLLKTATNARGIVLRNLYDSIGRLRKQQAGDFKAKYRYHRESPGLGRVERISAKHTNSSVSKRFEYDERGRIAAETLRLRAGGPSREHTFAYTYDEADRRTSVSYPSQVEGEPRILVTAYSPYGQPRSLIAYEGARAEPIVQVATYDLYGNALRADYGNGLSDRFEYGSAAELARLRCLRTTTAQAIGGGCAQAATDLRRLRIAERDRAGNVLQIADVLNGPGSPLSAGGRFSYDSLGRLLLSIPDTDSPESFAYDGLGNLTAHDSASFTYPHNSPHLATSAGAAALTHDADGNRTAKGPWSYSYDELGRLARVSLDDVLQEEHYYDEGRRRVARRDSASGQGRYYFGGYFEIEGSTLIRHYQFGGRTVATDRVDAPDSLAMATTGRSRAFPQSHERIEGLETPNAAGTTVAGLALALLLAGLFMGGSWRAGVAVLTATGLVLATTPRLPLVRALPLAGIAHAGSATPMIYLHADQAGSPHLLTDATGFPVEYRRYAAYGRTRAQVDSSGTAQPDSASAFGFGARELAVESGLIDFGGRFYDPELGLFLTPDPQGQFASPYLYGGGNPINGSDPDGEFVFGFVAALLQPILTAAIVGGVLTGIATALEGGSFVEGLKAGAINGAVGAGLGTLLGGVNIAYQLFAGGAQFISVEEALFALVEIAHRSAFTTVARDIAAIGARLAGANEDWEEAASLASGVLATYAYDQYVMPQAGRGPAGSASQRDLAKASVQAINTAAGHRSVTEESVVGTGWEHHVQDLVRQNLRQDGASSFLAKTRAVLNNEHHFGRLPVTLRQISDRLSRAAERFSIAGVSPGAVPVEAMGAMTHYVQDHLTLGHMLPGTALFAGPVGAPIRFAIHQVFGGEVAFRSAQVRATRDLLERFRPLSGA